MKLNYLCRIQAVNSKDQMCLDVFHIKDIFQIVGGLLSNINNIQSSYPNVSSEPYLFVLTTLIFQIIYLCFDDSCFIVSRIFSKVLIILMIV